MKTNNIIASLKLVVSPPKLGSLIDKYHLDNAMLKQRQSSKDVLWGCSSLGEQRSRAMKQRNEAEQRSKAMKQRNEAEK
jgi:hypothetical protein